MHRIKPGIFLLVLVSMFIGAGPAASGERCDLMFTNRLDNEILSIRVRYSTPYDKPRNSSSRVFLRPGGEYRIGVQGTILPERIIFDLADATYDFADLSGLEPSNDMALEVAHENGVPVLKRSDADGRAAVGEESRFLTAANRPNAVDRDYLTDTQSFDEAAELVKDAVEGAGAELGEVKEFTLDAGPIWDNDNAQTRCPEVTEEWNAANPGKARWTGAWWTTVPNEMSVCACVAGAAGLDATLFVEDAGWGKALYFPVFWKEWHGSARVQAMDEDAPEEGVGIDIRLRIQGEGVETMIDELLSDLRVDGYRPWKFDLKTWNMEKEQRDEIELAFGESDDDKYDAQDKLQEALFAAYTDGTMQEGVALWVKEDTFEKAKAGEEPAKEPGVMVLFSRGTFEALFIPDARMFIH